MKRTRFPGRPKLSRDAERLARLANGLADSGSRVEDGYWETRLTDLIDRLLTAGNDAAIESALDQTWGPNPQSYDRLIDLVEARTEGGALDYKGTTYDVLMIAAPVLVWSRYSIPAGPLPQGVLDNLRVQLQAHVLASGAQLGLADLLFSPDQLPRGYGSTLDFAARLWAAAVEGRDLRLDPRDLPQTQRFLSDTRYLLGAVAVPRGAPMFRWQEEDGSREQVTKTWKAQGGPCLQAALPGCSYEPVIPDAYYAGWRQADRLGRPYSLRSAVAFLQGALDTEPSAMRAVVAPFQDRQLEEYRIGITLRGKSEVVYGVVWALIGAEDETTDSVGEIRAVLRECGVTDLVELENHFPLEYCEDCGAPMFPNPEGEAVHAEMPDSTESVPSHLH
jgi:uncharacterized protein DUF2863